MAAAVELLSLFRCSAFLKGIVGDEGAAAGVLVLVGIFVAFSKKGGSFAENRKKKNTGLKFVIMMNFELPLNKIQRMSNCYQV